MRKFFEYLGYALGIIGIVLSIYFYEISKKERRPTFVIEPIRTEIFNSKKLINSPIRIIKSDSQEIKRDLTIIRFYFYNKGKESIKKENILTQIRIKTDPNTKIIDYKILKQARAINEVQLVPIDSTTIEIVFRILEFNDGFTGELLVEGNSQTDLKIGGIIEGSTEFSIFPASIYQVISKTFLYFLLGLLALGIFILSTGRSGAYDPEYVYSKSRQKYKDDASFKQKVDELEVLHESFSKLQNEVIQMRTGRKIENAEKDAKKWDKKLKRFSFRF